MSRTTFWGLLGMVGPSRVGNGSVKPRSNFSQPRSNLVNPSQTWSNLGKCVPNLLHGSIWCGEASPSHAGSARAIPFCVPTPEKVLWVKMGLWQLPLLCLTFLGTRNVGQRINDSIFACSDFIGFCAWLRFLRNLSRFACQSFRGPNGHSEGWEGSDEVWGGSLWLERSVWRGGGDRRVIIMRRAWWRRARSHLKTRRAPFRSHSVFFSSFSLSGPHFTPSALLLISCYPGLWLTRRFRLRAPRVSIFPSQPFISALNSRNVLIWSFSFLCLLVFFSRSRTPIDNQFSPTRPTGKHLSIPTLLFSFERLDWLLPFLCPMLLLCALLLLFPFVPLYVLWCIT